MAAVRPILFPGVALAIALSAGCDSGEAPDPTRSSPAPTAPAYRPVADVRQTMNWILNPAADVIWDSAGFVVTADGETDLSPTTDEGWDQVRNNAAVVAETGNLLMMPARSAGPGSDWVGYARDMTREAELAMAAAEARDAEALFDAGGRIYQTCRACHEQYWIRP